MTFDDGPSSKEYAIPLDAARNQTKTKRPSAKAPAPARASKASEPPTGGGPAADEPKTKRSTEVRRDKKSDRKSDRKTNTTEDDALAALPDPPRATQARVVEPASDGAGAGVVIGGLALAAVALGGLAGLVLRRRRGTLDEP